MSRGYTPRHAQTAGDLSFAVQFNVKKKCVKYKIIYILPITEKLDLLMMNSI